MSAVALATAMAVALTGCGGGGEEADGVATLQDGGGNGSTTTVTRIAIEDAALEFSRCMRDAGIDLPDIGFDASGRIDLQPEDLGDIDVGSVEFQTAFTGCSAILQQAGAAQIELDPELLALLQDRFQEFSQCMRENGITDFPDPDFTGTQPYPLTAFARFNDEVFRDALEACREIAAVPGLGSAGE